MNILLINIFFHDKNYKAFMKYGFNVTIIYHSNLNELDLSKFDIVYSPHLPINTCNYPNTKFLFGPHFSVFPEENHMNMIKGSHYIQPCEWAAQCWVNYNYPIHIHPLPFGVDTEHFNEIKKEKTSIFIYYKQRNPTELEYLKRFLNFNHITYRIFSYTDRYSEEEYLEYLQNSKYGIILGRHESQGFAIEEALSCNVPLLIWNVKSMNQEYGSNYNDIYASSIPYWDNRCGEIFYNKEDLEITFDFFIKKLSTYTPREYIIENISIEKCKQKMIDLIEYISSNEN